MLWGLTLQPGEMHTEILKEEVQLSMASLESRNFDTDTEAIIYNQVIVQTEDAEYVLCTLVHGMQFQQYLDIKLEPGEKIKFCVQGKYTVHLIGYSSRNSQHQFNSDPQFEQTENYEAYEEITNEEEEDDNDGGWEQESQQEMKAEALQNDDDVIDVPDETIPPPPVCEEQPAVIMSQGTVGTSQTTMTSQSLTVMPSPLQHLQQKIQQRRLQQHQRYQSQMRARRRLHGGQRPHVTGIMQRLSSGQRQREVAVQRRYQRLEQGGVNKHVHPPGKRVIRVIPSHASPSSRVAQHPTTLPQQQIIPFKEPASSSTTYQTTNVMTSEETSYPIAIEVPQSTETSVSNISQSFVPNFGGGLPYQGTSAGDVQSTESNRTISPVLMSGRTSVDMPVTPSSMHQPDAGITQNIPGTSSMADLHLQDQINQPGGKIYSQFTPSLNTPPRSSSLIKCPFCPAKFEDISSFITHEERDHPGLKSRQCAICGKIFSSAQQKRVHYTLHTGEKPHTCQFCSRSFRLQRDLRAHERLHTGERPYKCRYCDEHFLQTGRRALHERTSHASQYSARRNKIS